MERCKFGGASANLIRRSGCDIVLLSEMDIGMARSGNTNTIRTLAKELNFGYAFAVEFVEAGAGNQTEEVMFAEETNLNGLHGNGIISRYPLSDLSILEAPVWGNWYSLDWYHRRLGGRRSLVANLETSQGRLKLCSTHLESSSSPESRNTEFEALVSGLERIGPAATVVGGDFNTRDVPVSFVGGVSPSWFSDVERYEPLFGTAKKARLRLGLVQQRGSDAANA